MTIRRDLSDGYYEEISDTYLPNRSDSLPPLSANKDHNTVKIDRLFVVRYGWEPDRIIAQQLPLKQ